jgi:hypothetical protein
MKDCHTYAVELGEARAKRKEREMGMANQTVQDMKAKIPSGRSNGNTKIID